MLGHREALVMAGARDHHELPVGATADGERAGNDQQAEVDGVLLPAGGDIIVAIDGVEVRDMDDLIVYLAETAVGQTVTLGLIREGEELSVDVTLEERPGR